MLALSPLPMPLPQFTTSTLPSPQPSPPTPTALPTLHTTIEPFLPIPPNTDDLKLSSSISIISPITNYNYLKSSCLICFLPLLKPFVSFHTIPETTVLNFEMNKLFFTST